jgi:Replication-relaxation
MSSLIRRGRVTQAQLATLPQHLTPRDRQIAVDCFEHRVLTTAQLERLHFTAPRAGRRRLLTLYGLQVLDRFRPRLTLGQGTAPYHWVLGEAGAHVAAAQLGVPREELRYSRAGALGLAASSKLAHQLEVNECFTRLARDSARAGGALCEWYGERTTRELLGGVVPDGYGVLQLPGREPLHLLLELDRATEPLERLAAKAAAYARALPRSTLADLHPTVLLVVPTAARAAAATRAIPAGPLTPVVWSAASLGSPLEIALRACGFKQRPNPNHWKE